MNINGSGIEYDVSKIIDRSRWRMFLEIVGNEAKEYIYDQTLKGNFANGGPFSYKSFSICLAWWRIPFDTRASAS